MSAGTYSRSGLGWSTWSAGRGQGGKEVRGAIEHFVLRRGWARAKETMDRGKAGRAVFLVLAFEWAMNTSLGGPAGTIHYPDLRTLPPSDIGIEYDPTTGQKLLRFSNAIANLGEGPLEVIPTNKATTATTDAYQR